MPFLEGATHSNFKKRSIDLLLVTRFVQSLGHNLLFDIIIVYRFSVYGIVVWDDNAVEKLLDRSQVVHEPDQGNEEDEEKGGMNEYLRSFKVASYQIKTTAEEVGIN